MTADQHRDIINATMNDVCTSPEEREAYLMDRLAFTLEANDRCTTILTEIESALDDYNSPTHYGVHPEGNRLGTVERVRIGLLVLWSKWSESHREAQESEARADRLTTERYLAQELLDKLNAPRLAGGHELDLSARIRSLFTQKV